MIRIWHLLVIAAIILGIGGGAWLMHASNQAKIKSKNGLASRNLQRKLTTPEGYMRLMVTAKLETKFDPTLKVYISGTVTNSGKRNLKRVYIKRQLLGKDGKPKGKGKIYRIKHLKSATTKQVHIDLYTVSKGDLQPNPRRGGMMSYHLPPSIITLDHVVFAKQ